MLEFSCFIIIDISTRIEKRLTTYRKLTGEKIEVFKRWAKSIEIEVRNEKQLMVFEISELGSEETAVLVSKWIISNSK